MTSEEFVFKWKHELRGLLLDSMLVSKTGGERSLYLRQIEQKIDGNLRRMFEDAQQKSPAANGVPARSTK